MDFFWAAVASSKVSMAQILGAYSAEKPCVIGTEHFCSRQVGIGQLPYLGLNGGNALMVTQTIVVNCDPGRSSGSLVPAIQGDENPNIFILEELKTKGQGQTAAIR